MYSFSILGIDTCLWFLEQTIAFITTHAHLFILGWVGFFFKCETCSPSPHPHPLTSSGEWQGSFVHPLSPPTPTSVASLKYLAAYQTYMIIVLKKCFLVLLYFIFVQRVTRSHWIHYTGSIENLSTWRVWFNCTENNSETVHF